MIQYYRFLFEAYSEIYRCYKLYADLPGHLASISPPSTIPFSLSSSLSRPDIVLISDDYITLLELSVVTNTSNIPWLPISGRKIVTVLCFWTLHMLAYLLN